MSPATSFALSPDADPAVFAVLDTGAAAPALPADRGALAIVTNAAAVLSAQVDATDAADLPRLASEFDALVTAYDARQSDDPARYLLAVLGLKLTCARMGLDASDLL